MVTEAVRVELEAERLAAENKAAQQQVAEQHLLVDAAGPDERRVELFRMVGRHDDDAVGAVHHAVEHVKQPGEVEPGSRWRLVRAVERAFHRACRPDAAAHPKPRVCGYRGHASACSRTAVWRA